MSDALHIAERGPADPFARAYQGLRCDVVNGAAAPGDQIVVIDAAKRLAMSPTPVREALARLSGEGLIEDRRRHGYFVPLLSWFDLLELYDLCEMHAVAAIREAIRRVPGSMPDDGQGGGDTVVVPATEGSGPIMIALLGLSRNTRLVLTGGRIVDCLGAALRTEAARYGTDDEQLAWLREAIASGAWGQALPAIRRMFRTHRGRAEPVAQAMAAAHRARNRANIV